MRRFGLADGVGAVAAVSALAYLPGLVDPLTYSKLLVLVSGGLALAPAVVARWRVRPRSSVPVAVVASASCLLIAWGLLSILFSGAPWALSLFGWWGRGDGWLAWLGACILLLGAATLNWHEVARAITWLLGGATVVAAVGFAQVAGVDFPQGAVGGGVTGLMGNTNFAAGYLAILAVLALGRALTQAATWQRIWGGALFASLAALSYLTEAQQGPAALGAGLLAFAVTWAILNRGRWRLPALVAAGGLVVVSAALLIASFFAVGPLARLWSEGTFDIRQQYWQSAINIMNGVPIFGAGPDGFARYVGEYRPESYVELLGPVLRVSAAHNVALQFGAVLGWVGLACWILLFLGALVLLFERIVRAPVASIALTASVFGALVAYVIQGMVSIDMLPLLATGWTVAGLALAMSQEPKPLPAEAASAPPSRKAKARSASRTPMASAGPKTPAWVPITGAVLGLGGVILVGVQISAAGAVQSLNSQQAAVAFVENPLSPCPLRIQTTQQLIQQTPADVSVPATNSATALDPRCAPMINFQSELALQSNDLELAGQSTQQGVTYDPLFDVAWSLRARYLLASGDVAGARMALDEARRVQSLYPETSDKTPLDDLEAQIVQAGG